jgi:hypothetical protein
MQHIETLTETASSPASQAGLLHRSVARFRGVAWAAIVVADIGLLAWAAMAALAPELLMGPGSAPILPAGYEGFTGGSWQALADASAKAPEYVTLVFRMYGFYGVAFSILAIAIAANSFRRNERWAWLALLVGNTITYVGAMAYDQIVRAVGPFELAEYLGLAVLYASLAVTAPTVFHNRAAAEADRG